MNFLKRCSSSTSAFLFRDGLFEDDLVRDEDRGLHAQRERDAVGGASVDILGLAISPVTISLAKK